MMHEHSTHVFIKPKITSFYNASNGKNIIITSIKYIYDLIQDELTAFNDHIVSFATSFNL